MIDLHLHTNASDGRSAPHQLVQAARRCGLTIISVTDHDTVAAVDAATAACAAEGLRLVTGIEITSTRGDAEVHVLGYFVDHRQPRLLAFLEGQRADRERRVREMLGRLRGLGVGVDETEVFGNPAGTGLAAGRAIGRPFIARALVRAGHVRTSREAFDSYLAEGRPAFVPRCAPPPETVFGIIHEAGGIASLAHPALLGHDDWIPGMVAAGLDAIEVFYIEHPPDLVARYSSLAAELGLAVSGGSDFHGDAGHGPQRPGDVVLPPEEFERLEALAFARKDPR